MIPTRRAAYLAATLLLAVACAGPAASPSPAPTAATTAAPTGAASTAVCDNLPAGSEGDLLATICDRGKIVISTDADYAPQSSVTPSGGYEGFDIDVGEEIARRLGVQAEWSAQIWDTVIAGSWSGRWDMSVGSITVCCERDQLFDFTQPYYYTPAQVAVLEDSGFASIDDLAGETACVGEDTTYLYWVEGTLELAAPNRIVREAPEGMVAHTLETDANCAEAMRAGQTEVGQVFITADPVIEQAIGADTPIVRLGDPIFYEALAVAFDKNGPERATLLAEVDRIIGEMHDDGTLSELSDKWYGRDYSIAL
jgi:polar amino acid transport system substrate-binding protein